jgi:CBS domain containing-hemolysin-like protein
VLFTLVLPVTLLLSFLLSIASLAESSSSQDEEEQNDSAVDALIEAGKEEGIIEESDRDLVRSAVEFGDKIVREAMTARPDILAVPGDMTLEALIVRLKDHSYSRIPVYSGSLDQITGIVLAHDLLQIPDDVARTKTAASIQRTASFVPETKGLTQLLRDMQREKQQMRIAIDEYGGVAGLVTIEDLLAEIVGAIRDEYEVESEQDAPVRQADGSWSVPGSMEVASLKDLLDGASGLEQEYEATTVAGLLSEIAGRIPPAGEVIAADSLRFEVTASTDRRVERVRISPVEGVRA